MAGSRQSNLGDSSDLERQSDEALADFPTARDEAVEDIDDMLSELRVFLCFKSQKPLEHAEAISGFIQELTPLFVSDNVALGQPRKERPPMVTEKPIQKSSSPVASGTSELAPELSKLLASIVDKPEIWMKTPSAQFGGRRPIELVGTEEEFKIFDILHAVDQGLF
jgi:hypothetical protein